MKTPACNPIGINVETSAEAEELFPVAVPAPAFEVDYLRFKFSNSTRTTQAGASNCLQTIEHTMAAKLYLTYNSRKLVLRVSMQVKS